MTRIMLFVFNQMLFRWLACFVNSTQVITDLTTCVTNLSTTQQGRAVNPTFPLMDLTNMLNQCILKFQEAAAILNYITYGNIAGSQGGTITQGSAVALLQSGDSNQANTYAKAVSVLNDLA